MYVYSAATAPATRFRVLGLRLDDDDILVNGKVRACMG